MSFTQGTAGRNVFVRGRGRADAHAMFGHVMGLVALTVGCAALGAYLGRNQTHTHGFLFMIGTIACIIGLNVAASRGAEQLAVLLLFGMGVLLGLSVGPIVHFYAKTDPTVLYQATGATALFCGGLGAYGYATRRDFASWARGLFWALIGLIVVGFAELFIHIPHGNIIYCVLGLGVFGLYTVFDFNRLARTSDYRSAAPIAASIFLDIFNVFLLLLNLFSGRD